MSLLAILREGANDGTVDPVLREQLGEAAGKVVAWDRRSRDWLRHNDPNALAQLQAALEWADTRKADINPTVDAWLCRMGTQEQEGGQI